jgi:hypothetical protein
MATKDWKKEIRGNQTNYIRIGGNLSGNGNNLIIIQKIPKVSMTGKIRIIGHTYSLKTTRGRWERFSSIKKATTRANQIMRKN